MLSFLSVPSLRRGKCRPHRRIESCHDPSFYQLVSFLRAGPRYLEDMLSMLLSPAVSAVPLWIALRSHWLSVQMAAAP